jgi:hypothetical protein
MYDGGYVRVPGDDSCVPDLKPCQVGYLKFCLTNEGTNPLMIWKHIRNVVDEDNGIVEPEQEYYTANPGSNLWKLSNYIHYDMSICQPIDEWFDLIPTQGQPGDLTTFPTGEVHKYTDCEYLHFEVFIDGDYTHTEFQVIFAPEAGNGNDPMPEGSKWKVGWMEDGGQWYKRIGYNDGDFVAGYGYWPGGSHEDLPADMTIVGEPGDEYFKLSIPKFYIGNCGDPFYWAIRVGARNAGGTKFAQYPLSWKTWDCNGIFEENFLGILTELINEDVGWYLTDNPDTTNLDDGVACKFIPIAQLEPGETIVVIQSYHLDEDVENWGQSDMVTFDIDFLAHQVEGDPPPAPPTPLLPQTPQPPAP